MKPTPKKPKIIIAQVEGSGTAEIATVPADVPPSLPWPNRYDSIPSKKEKTNLGFDGESLPVIEVSTFEVKLKIKLLPSGTGTLIGVPSSVPIRETKLAALGALNVSTKVSGFGV